MPNTVLLDDEVLETEEPEVIEKNKKVPFAYWIVEGKEYKLKLKTREITKIEQRLGGNLLSVLNNKENSIPPIATMLYITHAAMQPWNHGITLQDVYNLFDKYCDEGGSQLAFFAGPFMDIYSVSGFFTENQNSEMEQNLKEAKASF